ncbi:MAG: hypothetical protein IKF37_02970 [Bacilli bacterium]|nr:hypothetical protein [Bacilli bacterium]
MKNELKNVNYRDVLAYLKGSFYDSYQEYVKDYSDNQEYKKALDDLSDEITRLTSVFSRIEYLQNNVKVDENEVVAEKTVENNNAINDLFNISDTKTEENVEVSQEAPAEVANTEVAPEVPVEPVNTEVVPEVPAEPVNTGVVPEVPAEPVNTGVVPEVPAEPVNTGVVPEVPVEPVNTEVVSEPVIKEPLMPTEANKKVITKVDIEMPKAILVSEKQKNNLVTSKDIQEALLKNTVSKNVEEKPVNNIEAMMAQANALYKEGRVAEAQSLYDQISQLNREMNGEGTPATDDNAKVLVK